MKPTEPRSDGDRTRVWRVLAIPGLEIGVKHSPVALEFPRSLVFDYRIVLNGHGRGLVRFAGHTHRMPDVRHVVFLQHPDEEFQGTFDGPGGASGACLGLSADLVAALHGDAPDRRWRFPSMLPADRDNAHLAALTGAALRAIREPTSLLERQTRLLDLVQAAMRTSATPADAQSWSLPRRGTERSAVTAVRHHFHDQPGHSHSMPELATLTGLNPRYLIRAFAAHTGLTPHRYLTALRIQRSKDLVLTGQPLSGIAADLGFADQAHFTRVFRTHVHVPPSEFRRLSLSG